MRRAAQAMPEAPSASSAAARRPQSAPARADGGHNITVAVRVRPLNAKEVQRNSWSCLRLQEGRQINVADPDDKMGGVDYLRLDKSKGRTYDEMLKMLTAWHEQATKLGTGEITKEQYDQWRYRYPEFDTAQRWVKIPSQELSDSIVDALKKEK